jgi:hypothetical protein
MAAGTRPSALARFRLPVSCSSGTSRQHRQKLARKRLPGEGLDHEVGGTGLHFAQQCSLKGFAGHHDDRVSARLGERRTGLLADAGVHISRVHAVGRHVSLFGPLCARSVVWH